MEQQLNDIEKTCKDCGQPFIFSAKDQAFFKKMVASGTWSNYIEPSRCLSCRKKRQSTQTARR